MKTSEEPLKTADHSGGGLFEFAGLRLDLARRALERGGEPVHLYPRAFDALALLVEHRNELLTKERLLEALWPEVVVEENSLARVISDLRKELGEAGASIVTVARRGYRFGADVKTLSRSSPISAPSRKTLAVLPFTSINGDEDDKLLAFGLTDALITRLSRLTEVAVRPTNSVVRFGDAAISPAEAGRSLKVGAVLCGVLRRAGAQLRASVQLIDVDAEAAVWAEQFDTPAADIFTMEDSISKRVGQALALELTRAEDRSLTRRHTDNAQAYDLYLRGRYWLSRRSGDWKRQSVACLNRAVELDSNFALAYAALAEAYFISSVASATMDPDPPRDVVPKARAAAERALALDEDLSEAHASLGHIAICFDWDWHESETRLIHALRLNPNNATARQFYAMGLSSVGRTGEALEQIRLSRELEPTSVIYRANLGFILYRAGRIAEAVEELRNCVALEPDAPYPRYRYGVALAEAGEHEEALRQFDELLGMPRAEVHGLVGKGHLLAITGRTEEARAILTQLIEMTKSRYVSNYYLAEICAGLGDVDEAMMWLDRAYDEGPVLMISLNSNPKFKVLRTDPRFQALLRRVGLWDAGAN
jgi:TolB-like protein/Flp pilus assembly protein TadD